MRRKAPWVSVMVALVGCGGAAPIAPVGGAYVSGHEVRSFQPCDGSRVFWVQASEEVSLELRAQHAALTSAPYEAIYIVVEGTLADETGPRFAADYDGVFVIDGVIDAAAEVPLDCILAS